MPKRYVSNDNNIGLIVSEIQEIILQNEQYSKNIINPEELEKDLYDFLKNHMKGDN